MVAKDKATERDNALASFIATGDKWTALARILETPDKPLRTVARGTFGIWNSHADSPYPFDARGRAFVVAYYTTHTTSEARKALRDAYKDPKVMTPPTYL